MTEELLKIVREHATTCWPRRTVETTHWTDGGLVENIPGLGVVCVRPEQEGQAQICISAGASAEPMEDGYGVEFFVLAPGDQPHAVKLVSMVAHLHADPRYPISLGQVIQIGQPWLPGASCDHLLVCLPDAFGPEFEWFSNTERTIRFIWLIPITSAEAAFANANGFTALQEKLGAGQVDLGQLVRESVV